MTARLDAADTAALDGDSTVEPSAPSARSAGLGRRVAAEALGTGFLVTAVIGSGIAASRLSPGQPGLQLLENSLATGAVLVALILAFQPVSAAFNPSSPSSNGRPASSAPARRPRSSAARSSAASWEPSLRTSCSTSLP